ncbi:hypothetical protein ACU686_42110 [Yinghuangia aomiensis]
MLGPIQPMAANALAGDLRQPHQRSRYVFGADPGGAQQHIGDHAVRWIPAEQCTATLAPSSNAVTTSLTTPTTSRSRPGGGGSPLASRIQNHVNPAARAAVRIHEAPSRPDKTVTICVTPAPGRKGSALLVTTARRKTLRFSRHWPWAYVVTDAVDRLNALPDPDDLRLRSLRPTAPPRPERGNGRPPDATAGPPPGPNTKATTQHNTDGPSAN